VFLGERGEFVLRERERGRDLLSADELDQVLLQQVKMQRRIEVEDLEIKVDDLVERDLDVSLEDRSPDFHPRLDALDISSACSPPSKRHRSAKKRSQR